MMTPSQKTTKPAAPAGDIFLVAGSDEFEVSRHAKALAESLCPEADRALGLEIIDGACDTVDECVSAVRKVHDAIRTVGFFGSSKLVWLRDASFFYESRAGQSVAVKEAVAALTEELKHGLLPGVRLLVSAAQVDKRTGFFKTMEKVGKVEFFNLPDKSYKWDEYAEGVLRDLLAKAGLKARADVMRLMIERAGPYPRQLHQEVEKLSLYVRDRKEITREDVLDIVSPARESSYGELADAFAKQDLPGALRVTRRLLQQKEQPVGLMMGLQTRVHDLLVYRTCLARRWARLTGSDDWPKVEWSSGPEAEEYLSSLANDPRRANPYWAGILAKQAQRFELDHLHDVQRQLVEIHGRITDGSAPADFMLEWFLITALGTNRHAA